MCYTLHTHREEMRGGIKVGYAVVHMMKIKSGAVGGIQSHNNLFQTFLVSSYLNSLNWSCKCLYSGTGFSNR
jgi:hypothetical protein